MLRCGSLVRRAMIVRNGSLRTSEGNSIFCRGRGGGGPPVLILALSRDPGGLVRRSRPLCATDAGRRPSGGGAAYPLFHLFGDTDEADPTYGMTVLEWASRRFGFPDPGGCSIRLEERAIAARGFISFGRFVGGGA